MTTPDRRDALKSAGGEPAAARPDTARPEAARRPGGRLGRRLILAAATVALATATAVALVSLRGGTAAVAAPPAKPFALRLVGASAGQLSLAAYRGRPLIINFFASWCVPCKRETPLLARFYRDHHGQVLVIGIDSNDHAAAALRFLRASGARYPVGFDPNFSTATAYGVIALPQTFFLNARHRIVRRVFGDVSAAQLRSWAARLTPAAGQPGGGTG